MKKLISVLLIVILTLSLSATAFAKTNTTATEETPDWLNRISAVLLGPALKRSGDTGTFDLGNGSSTFTLLTATMKKLNHEGIENFVFVVNGNTYEAATDDLIELFAEQPSLTTKLNGSSLDLLTDKGDVITTLEAES